MPSVPVTPRTVLLACLAMLAFAGNSLLCRAALRDTGVDPASFTAVRLLSGSASLALLLAARRAPRHLGGSTASALALFSYAAAFSFAYVDLQAGTGALLLFGAVQIGMLGYGTRSGERLGRRGLTGLLGALAGLVALLLPGASAPPLGAAALMLLAGLSWAAYSLLCRGVPDPLGATAGNFLRAVPLAL
ncbi:MAG: Permease, superfamily, partial [Frankiales bacterium]|nr:Permease, superfamily [Frankiales bacterium]